MQKSNQSSKQWYQHTWICVVGVIVLMIIGVFSWYTHGYNSLVSGQQNVNQQEGQVQTVLQRRGDVIPELVGAVKGSQKQEKSVYGKIAKARTEYFNACNRYNKSNSPASKARALTDQDGAINAMVGSIKEAYPRLDSNSNMGKLMVEVEGSNNRVSVERHYLNSDIQSYNTQVLHFPTSIIASMSNHHTVPYFKASSSAQKAPKVSF